MRYRSTLHPAPHLHDGTSTRRMMWFVVLCLLPALAWGVVLFGLRALLVVGVALVSAVIGELIGNLIMRRLTILDGSAVLSGLMIGLMLPPEVPLYIPVAASLFAMLVIKAAFGGLGSNWMNPAVGGQVFVYLAWGGSLAGWSSPRFWQTANVGIRSPLEYVSGRLAHLSPGGGVAGLMHSYPVSVIGRSISDWLAGALQLRIDPHMIDLLVGTVPGYIGTVSPVLLLIGSIALYWRRVAAWEAPVGFFASFVFAMWILGGLFAQRGWFGGFPLLELFSGSALMTGLFLCTDPVTSPLSRGGRLFFGLGIGLLTFLLRVLGVTEEAPLIALLVMNMASPGIERLMEWKPKGASMGA